MLYCIVNARKGAYVLIGRESTTTGEAEPHDSASRSSKFCACYRPIRAGGIALRSFVACFFCCFCSCLRSFFLSFDSSSCFRFSNMAFWSAVPLYLSTGNQRYEKHNETYLA